MANNIVINITTNAGQAGAQIQSVTAQITNLNNASRQAGSTGRDALDGFAGGLGIPTSIAAATAAIAAGVLLVGKNSIQASLDGARAVRVLKSDAQEAGIEFSKAQAEARKFGDDLQLSYTDAEQSYAKFLRVLKAGNELGKEQTHRRNIEQLIAAYGIAGEEVSTLFNQILSGQDEALNKLGRADPSKIYEKYAKTIGKAVDALTQEEKVRSIILDLSQQGAKFDGVLEERLTGQIGQWGNLTKTIADASRELGEYLNKNTLVGDIPFAVTSLLKGNGLFNVTDYQKQLEEQSRVKQEAAKRKALADSDAYFKKQNQSLGVPEALRNPFGSFANQVTLYGEAEATKSRDAFVAQYEALFKDKRLDKVTAQFAEKQFNQIRGILDPKKAVEIEAEFTKFWDKYAKTALGALKTARDAAEGNFDRLAANYAGANNPFTKVLTEADNNARTLAKTFGVLGDRTVRELQRVEDSFTRQRLLALQLDAQLKSNSQRREADELGSTKGLSGNQDRLLNELDKRINAATESPGLLAIANALRGGQTGRRELSQEEEIQRRYLQGRGRNFDTLTDEDRYLASIGQKERKNRKPSFVDSGLNISQDEVSREAIKNLRDLENFGIREGKDFGDKANSALRSAFVTMFNGLSPELQANIAKGLEGSGVRSTFVEAFRGKAEDLQREITEEIAKQAVADRAIKSAREDVAAIERARREGLDSREADARLLATTGALDPKELTADLRQSRIEALRREADANLKAQDAARAATDKAREATDRLTAGIDALAGEIRKPQNRKLLVEINNKARATVRDELYGSLLNED